MPSSYSKSDNPEENRLVRYRIQIQEIERSLDMTDRRQLTSASLGLLANDLREIIQSLTTWREEAPRLPMPEIEKVLRVLRSAQIELYIALDMFEEKTKFTESNRRSFYKCINNFQEYLYQSITYFDEFIDFL